LAYVVSSLAYPNLHGNKRLGCCCCCNQMFQKTGIGTLVSILKNPRPPVEDEGPKESGFEFEPQANEGCEEVSKVQILLHYTTVCLMSLISH
jgi:hypothetical protein